MGRPKKTLSFGEKIATLWGKLPSEVKVALYVSVSGFLAEVARQLDLVKAENIGLLTLAGAINIVLILLKTRIPEVRERLSK